MSKHPNQPITPEQFKALLKEEKELYKEVWQRRLLIFDIDWEDVHPAVYNIFNNDFERYTAGMIEDDKWETRQMYYPLPVEGQQKIFKQNNMKITQEQLNELQKAAQPLMDYLAANHHPHVTLLVTSSNAELLEGLMNVVNQKKETEG